MTQHGEDAGIGPRRAGRREANLRLLNERIAEVHDRIDPSDDLLLTIACECASSRCDDMIELEAATFDALRGELVRFAVVDGHVLHDVERVVEQHSGWMVVEKIGDAAREAAERLS
jgi:hypothetical protein